MLRVINQVHVSDARDPLDREFLKATMCRDLMGFQSSLHRNSAYPLYFEKLTFKAKF